MPRPKSELMPVKAPVEFTAERKQLFLEKFRQTGFLVVSAEYAGVVSRTVHQHRQSDKGFDEAYREALNFHTETVIEAAMVKRGVEGVFKPIIGGQFRDQVVTEVKEFSDACLLALARARKSEYGAKGVDPDSEGGGAGAGGGGGGGVLIVPASPHSIVDWEAIYGEKARGTTGRPASA